MAPKIRHLTRGEVALADWHRYLRHALMVVALLLMAGSTYGLYWGTRDLLALPIPFAAAVALAIEVGQAGVASTVTTIRRERVKTRKSGTRQTSGYYWHLWMIFAFLQALAQAANVGHAIIAVQRRTTPLDLPDFMPSEAPFVFAAAFAALFPLGGALFVHVSGFIRANGADSEWADVDGPAVLADPSQPGRAAPSARAAAPKDARPPRALSAQSPAHEPARNERAQAPAPAVNGYAQPQPQRAQTGMAAKYGVSPRGQEKRAAAEVFLARWEATWQATGERPNAAAVRAEAATEYPMPDAATTRRWAESAWETVHPERASEDRERVASIA